MGLDKTLIDLEQAGYDVRVFVLPAAAVGAWHERKRVFIIGSLLPTPLASDTGMWARGWTSKSLRMAATAKMNKDGKAWTARLSHVVYRMTPTTLEKPYLNPDWVELADGFPAQMDGHSLWAEEPADIPRLTEDVPNRSKRMKTLGNAVSPPQVFPILKYIADIETGRCPMGGEEP